MLLGFFLKKYKKCNIFKKPLGLFGSFQMHVRVFMSHFEKSTEYSVLFSVIFPGIRRIWEIPEFRQQGQLKPQPLRIDLANHTL